MIVITGAAGFIGSSLVGALNQAGYHDLVLVDHFGVEAKKANWQTKSFSQTVERSLFLEWLEANHEQVTYIFHLGARTDTTDFSTQVFLDLNLHYTQNIWNVCVKYGLPMLYASSAATYGLGELGFSDQNDDLAQKLAPLNPYAVSKNEMDKWAFAQSRKPFQWVGLKFFNVFGANETHKNRMASVVFHAYNQIKANGVVKLFRSNAPEFADGEQLRDFIYVNDICNICIFFMENRHISGIFNAGTGKARTFNDLAAACFAALNQKTNIQYTDMPTDIAATYQNFTQADTAKLRSVGYQQPFTDLETAITQYIQTHLDK